MAKVELSVSLENGVPATGSRKVVIGPGSDDPQVSGFIERALENLTSMYRQEPLDKDLYRAIRSLKGLGPKDEIIKIMVHKDGSLVGFQIGTKGFSNS